MKYQPGNIIIVYATLDGTPVETKCVVTTVEKNRLGVARISTKQKPNPYAFWAHPKQCEKVVK